MSIKRYVPKYKKLIRLNQVLWFETRKKVIKFNRIKWLNLQKKYYFKKFRFLDQDKSSYRLSKRVSDPKMTRVKKTYKSLLLDKQRLQHYYGSGRLKYYQLKNYARAAKAFSNDRNQLVTSSFLLMLENRLMNVLYRVKFLSSLLQARRLIGSGRVKKDGVLFTNLFYVLQKSDHISIDPIYICFIMLRYIKYNFPFFYISHKKWCRLLLSKRLLYASSTFLDTSSKIFLFSYKKDLLKLKKNGFKKKK